MRLRLGLSLTFLLGTACSSATVPDAGTTADAAVRADARPNADAALPDAPAPDATPGEDAPALADAAPDAGTPDAEEPVDSGPADSGVDPCGPVPRASSSARFEAAVSAWLSRCNPELQPAEALAAARFARLASDSVFTDPSLTYDEVSAGACGCAIEAAPCDRLAKLRTIAACDATFVSTATTGDDCSSDFECPTQHACVQRPVATGGGGGINQCFLGYCQPIVGLDDRCGDGLATCEPGLYCNFQGDPPTCRPKAAIGDECLSQPCAGADDDVLLLGPNGCFEYKGISECQVLGRAGASCGEAQAYCHDLYQCDDTGTCAIQPGLGQACATPVDVAMPDYDQTLALISTATFGCRVPAFVGGNLGMYCTQTGTTTGVATCLPLPMVGQPCGLGQGLAPACSGGGYCPGLETSELAPFMAACVPSLTEGSTCTPSMLGLNDPCAPGLRCSSNGKAEPVCAAVCGPGIGVGVE